MAAGCVGAALWEHGSIAHACAHADCPLDLPTRQTKQVLPLPPLPAAAKRVPAFVGGGTTDLVVDWQAVQETAEWFGVEPQRWEDVAHDCMLDTRWETAAASLRSWLDRL